MAVKKYIYCIAMAILTMSLLTGCGAGIELSDEENDMIAEYMAAALLKYDVHYEEALIYAEAAETPEDDFVPVDSVEDKTQQQEDNKEEAKTEVTTTEVTTVNDIMGNEKYHVTYLGVEEYKSYKEPDNEYFVVDAPTGCKLAVVQLSIENAVEEDVLVSLADKGFTYELVFGEGTSKRPLLTALMSGLQYYSETIPKGESKVGVVLFAVEKDRDISEGTVVIRNEKGAECRISLK